MEVREFCGSKIPTSLITINKKTDVQFSIFFIVDVSIFLLQPFSSDFKTIQLLVVHFYYACN